MTIYDGRQWEKDRIFKADPGQEITEEVYNQMLNGLPPLDLPAQTALDAMRKYGTPIHYGFLMGEPHSHDSAGAALYMAFGMSDYGREKKYYYLGLSPKEKELDGTYYFFECLNAFVNNGLFKESEFKDDQDAINTASDYEATLYKEEWENGKLIKNRIIYDPFRCYETTRKEER
jgi:hypothetical protein